MRKRVFCWLPTKIYIIKYFRNGFKWLSFAWLDEDGRCYETEEVLTIDLDWLQKRVGSNIIIQGLERSDSPAGMEG